MNYRVTTVTSHEAIGLALTRVKLAVIRDSAVPIGQPARCWLRCPCGGPPLEVHELGPDTLTTCRCGVTYTRDGWTAGKGN